MNHVTCCFYLPHHVPCHLGRLQPVLLAVQSHSQQRFTTWFGQKICSASIRLVFATDSDRPRKGHIHPISGRLTGRNPVIWGYGLPSPSKTTLCCCAHLPAGRPLSSLCSLLPCTTRQVSLQLSPAVLVTCTTGKCITYSVAVWCKDMIVGSSSKTPHCVDNRSSFHCCVAAAVATMARAICLSALVLLA